ncbi:PRC-barrel domain-containing protein [Mesorhizobium sp. YR577]|uniref:PRC-barrel domain-containing protein n=1 Tax=Mesorhizobium sp. YR577 TaxID=1884373 RepID=UPI0008EFD2B5|nr:PRC-barrel domain-containing protein [Mesorhizobium sp. YR577]SFT46992.1 PRC-barrel domain-containing protein [Mesorhizobium sp. YR577]
MFRNLLATTAIATLMATAAYAQESATPAPANPAPMAQEAAPAETPVTRADGHLASNIIGETVYNGTGEQAENIGKVNDIVISKDGAIESLVVGVGGFLGLGAKNVAVNYSEVDWAEQNGDRWAVVNTTKEQLQALPDFDRRGYDPAPAPAAATDTTAPATDNTAMAPATPAPSNDNTAAAPATPSNDNTAQAPAATDTTETAAIDKSQLTEVPVGEIRSEELTGTTVYGAEDANVGKIGDVVLKDEKVDAVIIDVGGFLGVGAKEVAVGMDKLAFMTDKDGNKYLYTNFTKDQLEAQPAYDKATFGDKRDEQLLKMN